MELRMATTLLIEREQPESPSSIRGAAISGASWGIFFSEEETSLFP